MVEVIKVDGAFKGKEIVKVDKSLKWKEFSITLLIGKLRLHAQAYVNKEEFFVSLLKHKEVFIGAPWF